MNDIYLRLRPRLFGIAYRMLGSRAEAEDIVQDAWLRWQAGEDLAIASAEAWLVSMVTRMCIDRLRHLQIERAAYTGPWLPEPVVEATPEDALELASDVSMAFLLMLERLAPEERAIFLLREVFEFEFEEIADIIGKGEAACRQALHRARERVQADRPRFEVSAAMHLEVLKKFVDATRIGARADLAALFAQDAHFIGDGGGKRPATMRVVEGGAKIGRFFEGIGRKNGQRMRYDSATINGQPGLLMYVDGELDSTLSIDVMDGRISAAYVVRNPDKLARISSLLLRRCP